MILTIELPDCIVKLDISDLTTLKEIAEMVQFHNPVFFCDRWKGELGTLIAMSPNDDLIKKFNTDSIVLIDRNHIQECDVPRYYTAMTKGY
jgi:hypothetical protein